MVKRSGTIFIIVTVLLLLHSTCFAASRSTKTTSSATPQTTAPTQTSPTLGTSPGTLAPKLKANLVVEQQYSYAPVKDGMITPGANMMLNFSIKNAGLAESGNLGKYSIICTVISGGECPLASSSDRSVPNLAPGASKSFTLIGASGAEKGKYRIVITTKPTSSRGRPWTKEFTVGDMVLKKTKTPRAIR